jgi:hypothetical protein
MKKLILNIFFLFLCLFFIACSPSITIRHNDPTHRLVQVVINGINEGEISYDDKKSFKVAKGRHKVEITPNGENINPWTKDNKAWYLFVDRGAELVLLPVSSFNQ